MTQSRSRFQNRMNSNGLTLIDQPYLESCRMRPDFYCIEDETYYIVIENRQAYHSRKRRIEKAISSGTRIKVVTPDGDPYPAKKPGRMEKLLWEGLAPAYSSPVGSKPPFPVPSQEPVKKKEIAHPVSITLYPDQVQGLKKLAKESGGSVSGMVRGVVGRMLEWKRKETETL